MVNIRIRKMVNADRSGLSDAEKENKRETEQDRVQREILKVKQKQNEEEREKTKKVDEKPRHGVEAKDSEETNDCEGSGTGSSLGAKDKQEKGSGNKGRP